jgi:ERCC4-type nuclease
MATIYIQIDNRERDLIVCVKNILLEPSFQNPNIILEIVNLPLGDIILSSLSLCASLGKSPPKLAFTSGDKGVQERKELLIMERKSIHDLSASIRDGRYDEQSFRLNGISLPNHNILYLVEGEINSFTMNRFKHKINKNTLYSALFSLNYYKGFSVVRTFSLDETAFFICNTANKLLKEPEKQPYYKQQSFKKEPEEKELKEPEKKGIEEKELKEPEEKGIEEKEEEDDYCNVVKRVKRDNITPDNISIILLSQIPGISVTIATAICSHFHSLKNLLEKIDDEETKTFYWYHNY